MSKPILIPIAEVQVGMVLLERSGRARVKVSRPCYGESGWMFVAEYIEGPWIGQEMEHRSILDNAVWQEPEE